MELKDCRIVFMGTPPFAVSILESLIDGGCTIVAVVTAPDKPAGRGMQLAESAVKKFALSNHLPVLQPVKLKDPQFLEELKNLKADLQVVVAFRMLPELVWDMPTMGTINLHASLLPQYRGAAPINWAIIHGEKETGLTTFKLQHEIDTGDILLQKRLSIGAEETAGELHDRMMIEGGKLMLETLKGYCGGELKGKQQSQILEGEELKLAPKLNAENCKIDWSQSAEKIHNQIRGLSPSPGAYTLWKGKMVKIYKSTFEKIETGIPVSEYTSDGKTYVKFAASDGWVSVLELQMEGKKRMDIDVFLRGFRV